MGNLTSFGKTLYDEGTTSHTEAYTYTYDNWGRQQNTTHSLDGGTAITLSSNSYDAVGRLSGTTRGGSSALASTYTYNVRSWLTGINGPHFSETLTYETPRTGSSLPGQWGGNISGMQSTAGSSTQTMRYDFGYDLLGRLTTATYGGGSANSGLDHSRTYSYDLNGNMTGRRSKEGENLFYGAWLKWTWDVGNGNRPNTWHQQREFVPNYNPSGPAQVADAGYTYDGMGNRTAELDAQGDTLTVLRYNRLNLPEEYMSADGDTLKYVYSADGEKLYVEERSSSASGAQGTEYAANYRIENGTVTMIHTDAGYYTPTGLPPGASGPSYLHLWYLKDHLGNNRVLANERGIALSTHHYDPYGTEISISTTNPSNPFLPGMADSPYKYGGKEWNATTSTYDFEARYLSPSFHRFTTMDPLAEKYYSISPYSYCSGNPINRMDPNGKDDYEINKKDGKWTVRWNYDPYDRLIAENGNTLIIKDKRIMEGMREGVVPIEGADDTTLHYTVSSADNKELLDVFKFFSDNTDVEWELFVYDDGHAVLATDHLRDVFYNMSYNHYLKYEDPEIAKSQLLSKVHNHNKPYKSERSSMAHDITNSRYLTDINNYVYFGASGNVYIVTGQGIYLTGKIGDLKL